MLVGRKVAGNSQLVASRGKSVQASRSKSVLKVSNTFMNQAQFLCLALGTLACSVFAQAAAPAQRGEARPALQVTPVAPLRWEKRGALLFADFGKAAWGNLQITFEQAPAANVVVRLGEKLGADGAIDRKPPGSVNFREIILTPQPGQKIYRLSIPGKPFHKGAASVKMPPQIGEVTPFRYAEIEGAPPSLLPAQLRQLFVHAPFDDNAAHFQSSDPTLNAVWELCKHTMKATTAFGVYIDGERERIPYEADAYINQLSHLACDFNPTLARDSIEYLLEHPTWPTEWSFHTIMMAAADYEASGDIALAARHYGALKAKLLMDKAREDGLLRAWAIVDWPAAERDGYNDGQPAPRDKRQVGPEVNTVVNAFYFHALERMAFLARALKKEDEARDFEAKSGQVYTSFNRHFWDAGRGIYTDGEGSAHASLHANMFALAFGLVPAERQKVVADFVESRHMACSVYGAQYLLEALFKAGRDAAALRLLTSRDERSWWHMIEVGSTMTLEAWDAKYKSNLTWNHAWGAAPANLVARFVLGVRPLSAGYRSILIAPQPGTLQWARGRVPTPRGPVEVNFQNAATFRLEIIVPQGAKARLEWPRRGTARASLDGKTVPLRAGDTLIVVNNLAPGRHILAGRAAS